jgi:hypothetical protein
MQISAPAKLHVAALCAAHAVLFLLQGCEPIRGKIWCTTAGMQVLPQDYDAQPAAAKLDLLWKNITDTRCGSMPRRLIALRNARYSKTKQQTGCQGALA